ncbi:hypothetical protein EDB84DRAFT_1571202 [Lactarius hengduanensis]|nr:hypothetical protein EDB84DRAFT_1571202 [Lactarius hengduanensis]
MSCVGPCPLPVPSSRHTVHVKRGHATPRPLPSPSRAGRGAHEGTPPPVPPFPLGRGVRAGRGVRDTLPPLPVATGPSPSPFDRAALYARERGTRGYATPGPTLPIHAEGGHRGTPPSAPPFDRTALYAQERGTQGHATPRSHPSHSRGRGAHEGHVAPGTLPSSAPPCTRREGARKDMRHATPPFPFAAEGARTRGTDTPFPLAAPLRTRGQGAREGKPPHPVALHSRRKGHTRPPASLRVAQQDRRHPCARVHRPHPVFRAIVRLRQK